MGLRIAPECLSGDGEPMARREGCRVQQTEADLLSHHVWASGAYSAQGMPPKRRLYMICTGTGPITTPTNRPANPICTLTPPRIAAAPVQRSNLTRTVLVCQPDEIWRT